MVDDTVVATAQELRQVFGVKAGTLRQWVFRGHVRRVGRYGYVLADVVVMLGRNDPRTHQFADQTRAV